MPIIKSTLATKQEASLTGGGVQGVSQPGSAATLRILYDVVTIPVGAPAVTTAQYIRFGKIPAGAVIHPNLSLLSGNHTATVAGKLQLVPVDGSSVQEITGVFINVEATESSSLPDVADSVTVAKDSWVQFVPTADLTIASSDKAVRARIVYAQTY